MGKSWVKRICTIFLTDRAVPYIYIRIGRLYRLHVGSRTDIGIATLNIEITFFSSMMEHSKFSCWWYPHKGPQMTDMFHSSKPPDDIDSPAQRHPILPKSPLYQLSVCSQPWFRDPNRHAWETFGMEHSAEDQQDIPGQ